MVKLLERIPLESDDDFGSGSTNRKANSYPGPLKLSSFRSGSQQQQQQQDTRDIRFDRSQQTSPEPLPPGPPPPYSRSRDLCPWISNTTLCLCLAALILIIIFMPKYREGGTEDPRQIQAASIIFGLQRMKAMQIEQAREDRNSGDFSFPVLLTVLLCILLMASAIYVHMSRRLQVQRRKSLAFWIFTVLALVGGIVFSAYRYYFESILLPPKQQAGVFARFWRYFLLLLIAVFALFCGMVIYEKFYGDGGTVTEIVMDKLGMGESDSSDEEEDEKWDAMVLPGQGGAWVNRKKEDAKRKTGEGANSKPVFGKDSPTSKGGGSKSGNQGTGSTSGAAKPASGTEPASDGKASGKAPPPPAGEEKKVQLPHREPGSKNVHITTLSGKEKKVDVEPTVFQPTAPAAANTEKGSKTAKKSK